MGSNPTRYESYQPVSSLPRAYASAPALASPVPPPVFAVGHRPPAGQIVAAAVVVTVDRRRRRSCTRLSSLLSCCLRPCLHLHPLLVLTADHPHVVELRSERRRGGGRHSRRSPPSSELSYLFGATSAAVAPDLLVTRSTSTATYLPPPLPSSLSPSQVAVTGRGYRRRSPVPIIFFLSLSLTSLAAAYSRRRLVSVLGRRSLRHRRRRR
jgi:hypothetical protein